MKKHLKYISLILVALMVSLIVKNVVGADDVPANTAFDDYNFYKIVVDAYNKENEPDVEYNHSLTDDELKKIKSLSYDTLLPPFGEPIKSVKGIEKLTNLEYLNLIGNDISTINLSNNTKLNKLFLKSNNLSSIDISHNLELEAFSFSSRNKIDKINLEKNTKLEMISISESLTSLDLSHQPELTNLYLSGANLSSIDLSSNLKLTELILSNCNFPYFNISNNTLLKTLHVDNCNLSSIDLSSNPLLTDLSVASNNLNELDLSAQNKLEYLDVSNNNLAELDFSKVKRLISLNIRNNSMLSLKGKLHNIVMYELADYSRAYERYNSEWPLYFIRETSNFTNQDIVLKAKKSGDKYIVDLKEYYPNLDTSKIELSDLKNGIISIKANPSNSIDFYYRIPLNILYSFKKDNELEGNIEIPGNINIDGHMTINIPPEINTFYIGGSNNPEYSKTQTSSINLSWNADNITHYCISTTNDSSACNWVEVSGKSVNANYTLPAGDGTKTIYAFIKNIGNIISDAKSDTIKLDATLPVVNNFYIGGENNPEYTNTLTTSIYLKYTEANAAKYCINTENKSSTCSWKNISNSPIKENYTLTKGDGTRTLYAFVQDKAGNISAVKNDVIKLDTTKPTITNFYLGGSNNPEYASSINSKIYLNWKDNDVSEYCITTTNSSNNCEWKSVTGNSIETNYTLTSILGNQIRYAYLKDKAGNISNVKQDNIILQTEKPLIKEFYLGGKSNPEYSTSTKTSIYLSWDNNDVASYCISSTNDSKNCVWKNTTDKFIESEEILDGVLGTQTRYAFLKNKAGLISESRKDTIILQTEKPLIKEFFFGTNKGTKYTNKNEVNVSLVWSENDISEYCLTTKNDSASCKWIETDTNKIETTYTLNNKDGVYDLYSFIKNKAGLISEVAKSTIIYDTVKPTIKEFYIGGLTNPDVIDSYKTNIYLSFEDNDVSKYCLNTTNNVDSCKWQNINGKQMIIDYTLDSGEGEKTLYAFIQDEIGYISEVKSDKVKVVIPKEENVGSNNDSTNNQSSNQSGTNNNSSSSNNSTTTNTNSNSNNNNNNHEDEKLPDSENPQTGGILVGIITLIGLLAIIFYKYYLGKKIKIEKI